MTGTASKPKIRTRAEWLELRPAPTSDVDVAVAVWRRWELLKVASTSDHPMVVKEYCDACKALRVRRGDVHSLNITVHLAAQLEGEACAAAVRLMVAASLAHSSEHDEECSM